MPPAGRIHQELKMDREIHRVRSLRRDSSLWRRGDDVFSRQSSRSFQGEEDDEEALRWAALERLPTSDRVRRAILPLGGDGDGHGGGEAAPQVVDVLGLGPRERRALLERLVRVADEDNERFLLKLKECVERCVLLEWTGQWTHILSVLKVTNK